MLRIQILHGFISAADVIVLWRQICTEWVELTRYRVRKKYALSALHSNRYISIDIEN